MVVWIRFADLRRYKSFAYVRMVEAGGVARPTGLVPSEAEGNPRAAQFFLHATSFQLILSLAGCGECRMFLCPC
jgi:hypothetical protein